MKMLKWSLALILSGVTTSSFATPPSPCCHPCSVNTPILSQGSFYVGLTGLYWRQTFPHLDSVIFESTDPTSFFVGGLSNLDDDNSDFNWGYQVIVGYNFACSANDVRLTYTHYDQDDNHVRFPSDRFPVIDISGSTTAQQSFEITALLLKAQDGIPVKVGTSTVDNGLVNIPDTIIPLKKDAEATVEQTFDVTHDEPTFNLTGAKSELNHHALDFDFGQRVRIGCNFDLRWFAGVRYAKFENKVAWTAEGTSHESGSFSTSVDASKIKVNDNKRDVEFIFEGNSSIREVNLKVKSIDDFKSEGTFDVTSTGEEDFREKSHFDGVGPRVGISGTYRFCGGFGLIGEASTALIIGEIDYDLHDRLVVDFDKTEESTSSGSEFNGKLDLNSMGGMPNFHVGAPVPASFAFITSTGEVIDPTVGVIVIPDDIDETIQNHIKHDRVVPNFDAKLGVNYGFAVNPCSRTFVNIEAGYKVSYYMNSLDSLSVVNRGPTSLRLRGTADTSFDGPYVSVAVSF